MAFNRAEKARTNRLSQACLLVQTTFRRHMYEHDYQVGGWAFNGRRGGRLPPPCCMYEHDCQVGWRSMGYIQSHVHASQLYFSLRAGMILFSDACGPDRCCSRARSCFSLDVSSFLLISPATYGDLSSFWGFEYSTLGWQQQTKHLPLVFRFA